ncbi:zinc metalloproteinase nas-13-like [Lytechinus pictus]|uniref:zinc metalloproteinase nas-13-like n=1 Tax=Lytechinus pictus TaxID=7653 RepID=UPI0030BA0A2B
MELSLILGCMSILFMGTTYAEYNYKTGYVNAQGVPNGGVDIAAPSFEAMKTFGTAQGGDAFTTIMEQNKAMNDTKQCMEQGDIPVPCNSTNRQRRNALRNRGARWINGIVPYVIDGYYDAATRGRILRAMNRYHDTTCLRFVQRTNQQDYIYIFPGNGCYSLVGRVGGQQQVSLGVGCTTNLGTIVHELMHAVGFHHEQTRTDRDDFVYIYRQNIIRGLEYNFDKYEQTYIDHLGTQYDYLSVMHYHMTAFTSNGQPTIVARDTRYRLDYRSDFSENDIRKINIYYQCDGTTVDPTTPEEECMDMNEGCSAWAQAGYCQTNQWVMTNCKQSCGTCTPTPTTGTGGNDCMDSHSNCAAWAQAGECQINPTWMLVNCKVSCDQCDTGTITENCKDQNDNCEVWAKYMQCTENPSYMLEYCPRSCGQCSSSNFMNTCEDYHDNCEYWASNDQCQENPGYMNYECRKSCNLCVASSPVQLLPQIECQDTSGYCPIYSEDGMCESNPSYMGLVCPDTCRMCPGRSYPDNGASGLRSFFGFIGALVVSFLARKLAF